MLHGLKTVRCCSFSCNMFIDAYPTCLLTCTHTETVQVLRKTWRWFLSMVVFFTQSDDSFLIFMQVCSFGSFLKGLSLVSVRWLITHTDTEWNCLIVLLYPSYSSLFKCLVSLQVFDHAESYVEFSLVFVHALYFLLFYIVTSMEDLSIHSKWIAA